MNNQYSIFSLREMEKDRDEAEDRLNAKVEALEKLSREVDGLAAYLELVRNEIAIRKANRVQWNGKPTKMEFVDA